MTFRQCAERYIAAHQAGWRNAKHTSQWRNTLATYAFPVFGDLPVQAIDVGLVMKVVEPLWPTKTETASRLRGRIENVLDWALARGYRQGDNPARWRGHLDNLLPRRSRVQKVEHHAALSFHEVGAFIEVLQRQEGVAAMALEFCILTATRTSETIGARWQEVDLREAVWMIPTDRIKAGKEHRVPLSKPAVAILVTRGSAQQRLRVSRRQAGQASIQYGTVGAAEADGAAGPDGARVSQRIPRLGCRADQLPARGLRDGARAHHRRQGGGGLPTRRPVLEAQAADGGVRALLLDAIADQERAGRAADLSCDRAIAVRTRRPRPAARTLRMRSPSGEWRENDGRWTNKLFSTFCCGRSPSTSLRKSPRWWL